MEAVSQASVLQKLLDGLCQETDPAKIYKLLKKMSSVPVVRDKLAEIGFRKTIKRLKKQELLVPFVKDLLAKWCTCSLPEAQPEQTRKDFGLEMCLKRGGDQNTCPKEKAQQGTFQEAQRDGREHSLWHIGHSTCKISCLSPIRKSKAGSNPRAPHSGSLHSGENTSLVQQLGGQNPVQPPCKRKRDIPSLAEAQSPLAKIPRRESPTSADVNPISAGDFPESQCSGQAGFSRDDFLEPLSSQLDQEASPWEWAIRNNHQSQVYSGIRPADHHQKNPHLGLLEEKTTGSRDVAHSQSGKVKAGPGKPEDKSMLKTQAYMQTESRSQSPTHLQVQQSEEERLQAFRARIQSSRAKMQQARQTRIISFHIPLKRSRQQNSNSLPEAPNYPRAKSSSCLTHEERGSKKAPAKKPAPLMAKSIKDYNQRFCPRKRM